MNIELIIWDCDGVLVDSEWLGAQTFTEILNDFGANLETEYVYNNVKGGSMPKSLAFVRDHVDIPSHYNLERIYRQRSDELFDTDLKPIFGVEEVLKQLPYKICVASNGPKVKIIRYLGITQLKKYFSDEHIFSGHDINIFKPEPDLFLMAAENMGVHPINCVVIEDSIHGVQAASRAGMKCFAYCNEKEVLVMEENGGIPFHKMVSLLDLLL